MEPRRAGALALGFSLVGVVLVVLVVGVAAGVGPSGLYHGHPHDPVFHAPVPSSSPSSPAAQGGPSVAGNHHPGSGLPYLGAVGVVIQVLIGLWLLSLIYRGLRWLREELASRRRRELAPLEVEFDVLEDPEPLVEVIRSDVDLQLELLLAGEPRNAIVACWERFEEQAERVGLARKPWETSSEFTLRLLDAVSADDSAVAELAALYREARFSSHPITEGNRQSAVEALGRIRDSVGVRKAAPR
jgi:hypothetical protein